jgi:hypothetical protein
MAHSGDPPLRLYDAPPITNIISEKAITLTEAQEMTKKYLDDLTTHPVLHPNASFDYDKLDFPEKGGTRGTASVQFLQLIERGMRGEEAMEEADLVKAELQQLEKESRERERNANNDTFKWEDKRVLEDKGDGVGSWAVEESVEAKNVVEIPELTTGETNGHVEGTP